MRNNIFLIGFIGLLFFSCNNSNSEKKSENDLTNKIQDSIKQAESEKKMLEQKKRDSILRVEETKVLADIEFGMSEKTVKEKLKEFKLKNRRPDPFLGEPYFDDFIGEYEYSNVRGFYDENKLYDLSINGALIHWEKYDYRVPKESELISDVIKLKYGEPNLEYEIKPRYALKKGYSYLLKKWVIGKKIIEIRLEDSGTYYSINVNIYLPEVREKIKREELEKEKSSAEKAKDAF